MRTRLVVAAVAALVAMLSPSVAHAATTTTLTVSPSTLYLSPVAGGSLTVHIDGNVTQDITVHAATPGFPWFPQLSRANGTCTNDTCTGSGDVTISYPAAHVYDAARNFNLDGQSFGVAALTADGASASGTVTFRFQDDLGAQGFYRPWSDGTASFEPSPTQTGPGPAPQLSAHITGVDTSLGVAPGCTVTGGAVDCTFAYPATGVVRWPIPVCSEFQPATVTVSTTIYDPNPGNNTWTVSPLSQAEAQAIGCAGSGGSPGGSGGGGGAGPPPVPSSAAPTTPPPTSTVDVVATAGTSSKTTTVGSIPTPVAGVLIARNTTGPTWGLLTRYLSGAVGVALVALVRWLRRRRRASRGGQQASDATSTPAE